LNPDQEPLRSAVRRSSPQIALPQSATPRRNAASRRATRMLTYNDNSKTDTDYSFPILRVKNVKIDDNVERLVHNSGYSNYNT
jgi:hypothetical protein